MRTRRDLVEQLLREFPMLKDSGTADDARLYLGSKRVLIVEGWHASRPKTVKIQFESATFLGDGAWPNAVRRFPREERARGHLGQMEAIFEGGLNEGLEIARAAALHAVGPRATIATPGAGAPRTDGLASAPRRDGAPSAETRGHIDLQVAAVAALDEASARARGQGFSPSPGRRRAIELRAMALAAVWLRSEGFAVTDTSATKPYDLLGTKLGEVLYVEVKGTSTAGEQVFLTRNEVEHARAHREASALVVVHGIVVEDGLGGPVAKGGTQQVLRPWNVDEGQLVPLAFQYDLPVKAK